MTRCWNRYKVKAADESNKLWERNSLSIELYTEEVFLQKLDYIHINPLQPKWNLCKLPEEYFYSSAKFYETEGAGRMILRCLLISGVIKILLEVVGQATNNGSCDQQR